MQFISLYTLKAVGVHFNRFIYLTINSHGNTYLIDLFPYIKIYTWLPGQKKCIIHCWVSRWFLLFYSPKPRSQVWILIAELLHTKRTKLTTMGKKMKLSTHPRKFGNHVTVHLLDHPSAPQANQCKNNSINRYRNRNATQGYVSGKSHSHRHLVKQRQLNSQ